MNRFRKFIDRFDWPTPVALTIEVAYEATPQFMDDYNEVSGGVESFTWCVVAIGGPIGQYHQPDAFHRANALLSVEPEFDQEVLSWCEEDFAHRPIAETDE